MPPHRTPSTLVEKIAPKVEITRRVILEWSGFDGPRLRDRPVSGSTPREFRVARVSFEYRWSEVSGEWIDPTLINYSEQHRKVDGTPGQPKSRTGWWTRDRPEWAQNLVDEYRPTDAPTITWAPIEGAAS